MKPSQQMSETMKLEQMVCSLENADRLQELGVTRESYFARCDYGYGGSGPMISLVFARAPNALPKGTHNAYTVAELGEMLPISGWSLQGYFCNALGKPGHLDTESWFVDRLVEALRNPDILATVSIWLLENNYVTTDEINQGENHETGR